MSLTISLSPTGILTITDAGGHSKPLPDNAESAVKWMYHLLEKQREADRADEHDHRIGSSAAPTIQYLQHFAEHSEKGRKAAGCPFCQATITKYVPGTTGAKSAEGIEVTLEDLGL